MLLRRTLRPTAAPWCRARGLSSWTNATLQEKLNSHPWVADCVVDDAEHIHGVSGNLAHVVPLFQTRGLAGFTEDYSGDMEPNADKGYQEGLLRYSNVDADGLNAYLKAGGYEGAALEVLWCTDAQLTNVFFRGDQRHERMVLRDIIYAMFNEADTDGDGSITLAEFQPLCEKYGIDMSAFHEADLGDTGAGGRVGLFASALTGRDSDAGLSGGDDYALGFVSHLRPLLAAGCWLLAAAVGCCCCCCCCPQPLLPPATAAVRAPVCHRHPKGADLACWLATLLTRHARRLSSKGSS
eukprot:COSAG05_NODE_99_length_19400_cov_50.107559_15_plen_296_part_00